jgi:hypothetical protein
MTRLVRSGCCFKSDNVNRLSHAKVSTQVTDAGLVHLKGLTNLSKLDLVNTQVTGAGIEELAQALHGLTIRC